jgi:hypothetical protein
MGTGGGSNPVPYLASNEGRTKLCISKKKMCFEKLLPHDTLLDPVGQNLRLQGFPTPLPMRGLIIYPKPSASSSDS